MKASWLWMLVEVVVGIVVYSVMIILLKPPVVYQAREMYANKVKNNKE